jgi:hypothetical protein
MRVERFPGEDFRVFAEETDEDRTLKAIQLRA